MTTSDLIQAYVTARRAQGAKLTSAQGVLHHFARETGNLSLADVTPSAVAAFLRGRGALSATWKTKFSTLAGFYRFAIARGHATVSALPPERPKLPPPLTPYVYSRDELQRLLDATNMLESPLSHLQAITYRTLLLLLYGAGLRISEALNLTLADVDLDERVLLIRDTKFYKSRLVPIGHQLADMLGRYIEQRGTLPMPQGMQSAMLASRSGRRQSYQRVITLFQRVRARAGITAPQGETRPPRLHDLRHTAAVHRLVAWYQQGQDVQQLLPRLATYLGHVSIYSTRRYLQMTPELLQQASLRFAAYARQDLEEVDHA
jgi:integrase/recombinase XerD